jgi:ATP-dependent Clp protease ATP-binding subunit ClpA
VIQQRIENPLATEILKGVFDEGAEINIDYAHGDFVFENVKASMAGTE